MTIQFTKYHGTGNDFIIINDVGQSIENYLTPQRIAHLCHRRFGIGADGLMLLQNDAKHNFRMKYYNSDGFDASMCGNGGRCITAFAVSQGMLKDSGTFRFGDDIYEVELIQENQQMWVSLKMQDVNFVVMGEDFYSLNTGSPHYVSFLSEDVLSIDVNERGRAIRYSDEFVERGINVNFCNQLDNGILVVTYERGVENETLSCGTGVVASSLAYALDKQLENGNHILKIKTKGGDLRVKYEKDNNSFKNIYLQGPAQKVFVGDITVT